MLTAKTDLDAVMQFKFGKVARLCSECMEAVRTCNPHSSTCKHWLPWTRCIVARAVTTYETLRKYSKELAGTFGLLVCDEAHRRVSP